MEPGGVPTLPAPSPQVRPRIGPSYGIGAIHALQRILNRRDYPMSQHDENSAEVMRPVPQFSTEQLKSVGSFDDALALIRETYGDAAVETAAKALGDGFALTGNKDQFLGVPLIFVHWTISDGDYPIMGDDGEPTGEMGKFVAARLVTKSGGKFIITDGGTGIAAQLQTFTYDTGKTFLVAEKGLRVSRYSNQYTSDGVTYYVDTSAVE
jgi:hypothetical protein